MDEETAKIAMIFLVTKAKETQIRKKSKT